MSWLVYALLAAVLWGMDYALSEKIFRDGIKPQTFLACQMLIGGVVFFIASCFTGIKKDIAHLVDHRTTLWLLIITVVVGLLANFFISLSIKEKNATLAGLIELSYPVFIVMFTWLFFRENTLTPSVILGGSLIFAGIFIIGYF